jgi:hypothetical protein
MISGHALAIFLVAPLPMAVLLSGSLRGIFLSPLLSGLGALFAGFVHLIFDVPIVVPWLVIMLIGYGLVFLLPALRNSALRAFTTKLGGVSWLGLGVGLGVILIVVLASPPPLAWDARSIWFFHASWLIEPAHVFSRAGSLSELGFSHPNYPILVPASSAVTWQLAGGQENLYLAEMVTSAIGLSAIVFAAITLVDKYGLGKSPTLRLLGLFLLAVSPLSIADKYLDKGYVDAVLACLVAAMIAIMLVSSAQKLSWRSLVTLSFLGIAASSVKQEGVWLVLAALLVGLIARFGRSWLAFVLVGALSATSVVLWKFILGLLGVPDESDASGIGSRLGELLDFQSLAWSIFPQVFTFNRFVEVAIPGVALALAIAAWLALRPRKSTVQAAILLGGTWLATLGIVVFTYCLGDTRSSLSFWLVTSLTRVTATGTLIGFLGIYSVLLVSAPSSLRWGRRSAQSQFYDSNHRPSNLVG